MTGPFRSIIGTRQEAALFRPAAAIGKAVARRKWGENELDDEITSAAADVR